MTTPRKVLSDNLKALMEAREPLGTLEKIVDESGKKLSRGTLMRVRQASHATSIDTLGEIAEVFGLEMWQLLVPNLNPDALPQLAGPELLNTIRSLVATDNGVRKVDSSDKAQQSGKKSRARQLPGEVLRTGEQEEKSSDSHRHGKPPAKRSRGGA